MKIVLFIGHHKVGTTSLQLFLAANAWQLKRHGILYPSITGADPFETPRLLARYLSQAVAKNKHFNTMGLKTREPHNALALKMLSELNDSKVPFYKAVPSSNNIFESIKRQARSSRTETIILCSEVLSNFSAASIELIKRMKAEFSSCQFHIMCTLRNVDEQVVSWHGQRLKFGQNIRPLQSNALEMYGKTVHFNYKLMLSGWLDVFPDAEITIRPYSGVLKSGGSVADFIKYSQIEFPGNLLQMPDSNPGLPLACYEICRRANVELPDDQAKLLRKDILKASLRNKIGTHRDVEMLGRVMRKKLFDAFRPTSEFLSNCNRIEHGIINRAEILKTKSTTEFVAASEAKKTLLDLTCISQGSKRFVSQLDLVELEKRCDVET